MCFVGSFLDARGLVTDPLGGFLRANSASWVGLQVLDLSDASAALVWLCDSLGLNVIKNNALNISHGFIRFSLDVLNALMHGVFGIEEASSAVLVDAGRNELLTTTLSLNGDCSDSVARACLSS